MDTNSPDEDHWWAVMAGYAELPVDMTIPENWEFFDQPPAAFEIKNEFGRSKWVLNPDAENLANLPSNYYKNLISGKTNAHVRVYVGNKYDSSGDGDLVYEEFTEDIHVAKTSHKAIPTRDIHVGLDFGRTPAASFGQLDVFGQWRDLHELVTEGVGAERFSSLLKAEIAAVFPNVSFDKFLFWGDPSGDFFQSGADKTYFSILQANGIPVRSAPTQDPTLRIEAGREPLLRLLPDGKPAYQINSNCKVLIKGFKTGYVYQKIKSTGVIKKSEKIEKNRYSHIHEARQYGMSGAGFGKKITRKNKNGSKQATAKTSFSVLR